MPFKVVPQFKTPAVNVLTLIFGEIMYEYCLG